MYERCHLADDNPCNGDEACQHLCPDRQAVTLTVVTPDGVSTTPCRDLTINGEPVRGNPTLEIYLG